MPHLPAKTILNSELTLHGATDCSFWLNSSAWEYPDYENVETFIERLVSKDVLLRDPVIDHALQDQPLNMADRTVRHRFLRDRQRLRSPTRTRCKRQHYSGKGYLYLTRFMKQGTTTNPILPEH